MFKVDVRGRIEKMKLSKNSSLLPLFEAIVNSFQSIEELGSKDNTYIKITLKRDLDQIVLNDMKEDGAFYYIDEFRIEDNGIGFNNKNFESFLTSDSTYKLDKGGKGIGRFLWLKAFEDITIFSTYEEDNIVKKRNFQFLLDNDPVKNIDEEKTEDELKTVVKLQGFKEKYKNNCPRKLEEIGFKIIEHCLSYFLNQYCPRVTLVDDFDIIDLNKLFRDNIFVNTENDKFYIENEEFVITHVKLYKTNENKNRIHYCANNREVISKNLEKKIPNLSGKMYEDGKEFIYSAYVSGDILDKNVNDERTNFKINNDSNLIDQKISMQTLEEKSLDIIKKYLEEYLQPIGEMKKARIEEYVHNQKPQYRTILKYKSECLDKINPNIKDEELEIELFKIKQKLDYETKKQGEKLLNNKLKDIKDMEEYKKKYLEYIEKENDLGKASLAEYIVHRKVILDLFDNALNINQHDKYALEQYIHNLIFPMKTISDDIDYEKHNLWLIDDRLSYHYYLASDIKIKEMDNINIKSDDRPDILIMDKPLVVTNENTKPYSSLTIIEFKRPMRNDYTDEENPISQVIRYTKQIRQGVKKDKKGRPLVISQNSPFYLYIIADLTPKLIEQAEISGLTKTSDGMGYFGYNGVNGINAYIEIISYEKLLEDSQKRNKILFDRLFTPKL
ncbi:ATP-binding protein [Clostridium botulinum]|nr:ATP-binding protein [Clostridium botulinum]NFJ88490.1 ATP-binding protein [Clostridium botulinum]HDI3121694.1 ATP-binding protein [Clostridium botulinum]